MNKNFNFISLDIIANKIYKNPLLKNVNYEDIIDLTLSVIKVARISGLYIEESCNLKVEDFKTLIPKTSLNIKTVNYCRGKDIIPMKRSSYTLNNQRDKTRYKNESYSYTINNQIIHTSFESGDIFITFDTIKIDEDGIPMIPDSEALIRAIIAYIKVEVYTVLVDLGKLGERALDRAEREYYFNIGKAQSEFQGFDNEDHLSSFQDGWSRLFVEGNDHDSRYENKMNPERIKRLK